MVDRKSVGWFLIVAFAVSWALFLLPLAFGAPGTAGHRGVALPAWSVAMWGPGIAALLVTSRSKGHALRELRLNRLGPRGPYLWAWLLPPALAIVAGALTVLLGLGRLDLTFPFFRQALEQAPSAPGVSVALIVVAQIAFSLTLAPVINVAFALGEELGWRGFLLPHLLPLGQWRAILLSGAIWGIWHAPAIAQGHNYPGQPVLGIFMMIAFCVSLGAILAWLYLRTGSPWVAALGHGSLNATAGLAVFFLATDLNMVWGGTLTSVAGIVALILFVGWLAWSGRLPVKNLLAVSSPHPASHSAS